ncbi:MAG: DHH family phosphoesterase, partial [Pseudomonadota bacterium]
MKIVRRPLLAEPDALPDSIHPVLRRVYAARDIRSAEQLDLGLGRLLPPGGLSQLEQAAELLATAVTGGQSILVVGDFDADGATSTALCVSVLRAFGARQVDFLVPNRFEYGYGLTPEIVEVARRRSPDLILTVDNGISSVEGVAAARAAGIKVLVTDHHLPGPRLPEADAIVNPQLPDDSFPSKNLAGVGVAFYVLAETRARLVRRGWFETRALKAPNLGAYLDLVALGTVADVVPLDRNNRVLVSAGLQRIRSAACRPGIRALAEVSRRALGRLVASDLAFFLAPRLNAAGRLDDMSLGIACLLERDEGRARQLA